LRSILCQIALGQLDEATENWDEAREPDSYDWAYGSYWLVRANILYEQGEPREALNAVVKSIDFQNKDIATFADALVARLFPGTEWSKSARQRLRNIMNDGMTDEPEKKQIKNVFFGLDEDMNEICREYLKEIDAKKETGGDS